MDVYSQNFILSVKDKVEVVVNDHLHLQRSKIT